jgi:hypothetical protein
LVEVLVAIFVTGVGLLALLALFPLGALTMAQAIKDDRTATAAANARAVAEAHTVRQSPWSADGAPDPFINPGVVPVAHSELPSYPVYVDPIGFQAFTGVPQGSVWVGAVAGGLPRRSLRFIHFDPVSGTINPPALRNQLTASWFSLLDDITYIKDGNLQGLPCPPGSGNGAVQRDGRYSWAFLVKRPRSVETKVVDLTVVVYAGRQTSVNLAAGTVLPLGETAYATPTRPTGVPASAQYSNRTGKTVLSVTWPATQEKPAVRKGGWVLDASTEIVGANQNGWAHGYFYRVVGLADTPTGMDLELQTPLREDVDTIVPANGEVFPLSTGNAPRSRIGRIFVLDNVVEVFEKGAGWMP